MVIIYYLTLLAPLMALFAIGYFPVAWLGRVIMKRRVVEATDAWAPLAGTVGTVVGFLFFGLSGFDRFAIAPDRVRNAWQTSGSAWSYELLQTLFSGVVCALVLALIERFRPSLGQNARLVTAVVALLISFITFSVGPVLFAPFL